MKNYTEIFGERKKQKYGIISNSLWILSKLKEFDFTLPKFLIAMIVLSPCATIISTYLPAVVIDELIEGYSLTTVLQHVVCMVAIIVLFKTITWLGQQKIAASVNLMQRITGDIIGKELNINFDLLENPSVQKKINNGFEASRRPWHLYGFYLGIYNCAQHIVAVIVYAIIVGKINAIILAIAVINVSLGMLFLNIARKRHASYADKLQLDAKQAMYINRVSMDQRAGKDIRIFNLSGWLLEKYDSCLDNMENVYSHIHNGYFVAKAGSEVLGSLFDFYAYAHLIYLLVTNRIDISSFVLLLGSIRGFSLALAELISKYSTLPPFSVAINYIREALEENENSGWEDTISNEKIDLIKREGIILRLKNVSYTYPGSSIPTLENVNLTIKKGEKLALLGLNGAGKTTLVKIICGLYRPTSGEVYINDFPQESFSYAKWQSLVSVMFQESVLLPWTIDENIIGRQSTQEVSGNNKLVKALELSGFKDKYDSLQEKGNSKLVREVNDDAVSFSGGEMQKLLFARALYKESPLIILDEPTSALDPVAENNLYINLARAVSGKTMIYISHRLSSTRFCDRIVLLQSGKIVEEGTHESLIDRDSLYKHLFDVQSMYYKEMDENKKRAIVFGDSFDDTMPQKLDGVF